MQPKFSAFVGTTL